MSILATLSTQAYGLLIPYESRRRGVPLLNEKAQPTRIRCHPSITTGAPQACSSAIQGPQEQALKEP